MQGHWAAVTVFEEVFHWGMGNPDAGDRADRLARVRRPRPAHSRLGPYLRKPSGSRPSKPGGAFLARTETPAVVLYEQNQLDAACTTGTHWPTPAFWPTPTTWPWSVRRAAFCLRTATFRAPGRHRRGRQDQAQGRTTRWIEYSVESELIRVWLAFRAAGTRPRSGDGLEEECRALLTAWRGELTRSAGKGPLTDGWTAVASLALARVAIAHGRGEEALACLEPLTHRAHAAGYVDVEVECLLLRALARLTGAQGQAQAALALADLEKALRLSSLGGYVLAFLSEGPPMQALLAQWLAQAGPSPAGLCRLAPDPVRCRATPSPNA